MIRKATTDDIPAIQALAEVAFRHTYATILSPEQLEYMMDWMYSSGSLLTQMTTEMNTFLIEDGKGYASFRPQGRTDDGRELYHLEKLYVLPSEQKSGWGRKLFEAVVKEVSTRSPARMELNVNRKNPAVGFYEHIGMHKARQGDFPIGQGFYMNDFIMAIDL